MQASSATYVRCHTERPDIYLHVLWTGKDANAKKPFYFSSLIAAFAFAFSSGVASRIPCDFACSMAFFMTSSSVFPRMTCLHPDDGSTLAHSMTLPMVKTSFGQ